MFEANEYKKRIGITGDIQVNLEGLRKLYLAHLRTFVFENIDCLIDKEISLETGVIFNKLVNEKRGGYCFELNLFFFEALKFFGFDTQIKLARVFYRGVGINAKTHLTVLVRLPEGIYIADAGFGGPGPEDLLKFELNTVTKVGAYNFEIVKDEEFGFMIKRETNKEFKNVFAFELNAVYPADLQMSNFYVSQLPSSAFKKAFNICKFDTDGRKTIFNNLFSIHKNGSIESIKIETFEAFCELLDTHFSLKLDSEIIKKLDLKWKELGN